MTTLFRTTIITCLACAFGLLAQSRSALQFYDSTGATPTAKFGWTGDPATGNFFIETPDDGNGITAKNGDLTVDGTVSASGFSGDGSGLSNVTATPNAHTHNLDEVVDLPLELSMKADTGHSHQAADVDFGSATAGQVWKMGGSGEPEGGDRLLGPGVRAGIKGTCR